MTTEQAIARCQATLANECGAVPLGYIPAFLAGEDMATTGDRLLRLRAADARALEDLDEAPDPAAEDAAREWIGGAA